MPFFDDEDLSGRGHSLFDRRDSPSAPPLSDYPVPPPVHFAWNEDQERALAEVVPWRRNFNAPRYMKFTGPGGSGKTAVAKELRRRLLGTRMTWSGMTGKAALRLRAAVGTKTMTAHSAVYHPPREVDNAEDAKIDLDFRDVKRGDDDDDDDDTLLVIDESSMIGPRFKADLDRSPYRKILLVGDPYQLSPVLSRAEEAEIGSEDYSVFADLSGPHLSKIMRNSGAVLAAATVVREQHRVPTESGEDNGSRYDYTEFAEPNHVVNAAVEAWIADPERTTHVLLAWKNDTRNLANAIVRHRLGYTGVLPEVGEPLVVRKNIHKKGLMNGDVVQCVDVGEEGPTLAGVPTRWFTVSEEVSGRVSRVLAPTGDFSGVLPYVGLEVWKKALREAKIDDVVPMTYAYCLTAHLAQGSQYRRVTVMIPGDFRSAHFNKSTRLPDGTTMPFSMRWLYTAASRATRWTSLFLAR